MPSLRAPNTCQRLSRLVEQAVAARRIPGAVVRIEQDRRTRFEGAWGFSDIASRRQHRIDDLFFLGSSSKPLASHVILSLAAARGWSLTKPAVEYWPAPGQPRTSAGGPVAWPTLEQMLSHTSGMFGNRTASRRQKGLLWRLKNPLAYTAGALAREPLARAPGSEFAYGGASMTVAAAMAERIAGQPFDELAHATLFDPLAMRDTTYRWAKPDQARQSVLYESRADNLVRARFQPAPHTGGPLPAGGIISQVEDLARFLRCHLDLAHREAAALSAEQMLDMRRDRVLGRDMDFTHSRRLAPDASLQPQGYGLGWILRDIGADGIGQIFFHGGAFGTLIWADHRSGLAIILLTNVRLAQVIGLWSEVVDLAVQRWG